MNLDIFRAYDVRGIFGVDFEPRDFYRIACAYTDCFQPKTVAVGHDVRQSSQELWRQVASGFQDSGVDVWDLGRISTDMLYFVVEHYQMDGGVVITASHNPAAFNGMKLVGQHAAPISADTAQAGAENPWYMCGESDDNHVWCLKEVEGCYSGFHQNGDAFYFCEDI